MTAPPPGVPHPDPLQDAKDRIALLRSRQTGARPLSDAEIRKRVRALMRGGPAKRPLTTVVNGAAAVDSRAGQPTYPPEVLRAQARIAELIPDFVLQLAEDNPDLSAADLHNAVVQAARMAGLIP